MTKMVHTVPCYFGFKGLRSFTLILWPPSPTLIPAVFCFLPFRQTESRTFSLNIFRHYSIRILCTCIAVHILQSSRNLFRESVS